MNDIPDFAQAVAQFKKFLEESSYPSEVFWVFRDDVWKMSVTNIWVKYPSPQQNSYLAEKVFNEGRERGLVDIHAVAIAADKIAATVWFPKYSHEEVQGWKRGMKLSIAKPLLRAKTTGVMRWSLLKLLPRFRHYQRTDGFIGTKAWAAAQQALAS